MNKKLHAFSAEISFISLHKIFLTELSISGSFLESIGLLEFRKSRFWRFLKRWSTLRWKINKNFLVRKRCILLPCRQAETPNRRQNFWSIWSSSIIISYKSDSLSIYLLRVFVNFVHLVRNDTRLSERFEDGSSSLADEFR